MPTVIANTPTVSVQPASISLNEGGNGYIYCQGQTTSGTLTYQWCKVVSGTWTLVKDAGGISGSSTANLSFSSATDSMAGEYFCRIGNGSGSIVSTNLASLAIQVPLGNPPVVPVTNPYNPTSLGVGDGSNFYCKRLPFGYAQDQRSYTGNDGSTVYVPGTVNSYEYGWEISLACGNENTALRAVGTNVTRIPFTVPNDLPISQQTRPAPFMTPANMTLFLKSCTQVFQDESCLDHANVWHPLSTSRPQGRWQFCEAASGETPTASEQITFPPPSGLGRSHYQGECSYESNVDGAS